jgi:hypothetical protein
MSRPFTPAPYHHTEQLRFKHLNRRDLFVFPASSTTPFMGPYMKLSARRYVAVRITGSLKLTPHIDAGAIVHHIGSVNACVSDRVSDYR